MFSAQVMPDDDKVADKSNDALRTKLALLLGFPISGPQLSGLSLYFKRMLPIGRRKSHDDIAVTLEKSF